MTNKIYVQQLDESDCGAAALAMILRHFGSKVPISIIRRRAQTDREGTTALGLVKAAQCFNLDTKAVKADLSLFQMTDLSIPFIAHVDKNHGTLHYVVVSGFDESGVTILDPDPAVKESKMSYKAFGEIWTGIALFFSPDQKYAAVSDNSDSLWHTARILLAHKGVIGAIIALMLITTLISIGGATFLQSIVDSIVPQKQVSKLELIGIGLLVSYIFHGFFTYLEGHLSVLLSKQMTIDVLLDYIHHLFKLPLSFFETRKAGEITSRFNDANNIIESLSHTAITAVLNVGTILIVGIALFMINVKLALIMLLAIPIYLLLIVPFIKIFDRQNNDRMEKGALLNSQLIEDLNGISSIKSLNSEDKMFESVRGKFMTAVKANYRYGIVSVIQGGLKDAANLFVNLSILFIGAMFAIHGQMTVGQLMAFNALLGYFLGPVEEIINLQDELQTAKIANARLNQVLLAPAEEDSAERQKKALTSFDSLEYKGVSFEYKYGQEILHKISFNVARGESVALVGFSGSRKTTLAKLLVNFYRPTSGSILVNGTKTTEIRNKDLRQMVAYLPQSPYIFSGTIAENIALSNPQISPDQIINAAKIAGIHQDILKLSDGYETHVSEGSSLSGGQLQRIAIARAVASPAQVLILDESTSNLDLLTEKRVLQNLLAMPDKTVIFIAHRLEVAKQVNKVVVMTDGRVIEQGTHQQLVKLAGAYHNLVS
ncbi:peptide cleavage/export ABC transporter [uncultured Secundilactobacillus sp.]|uniref:peptide cleavage/export ABC transporter n=1 Tax=uncultured Secundilactobacillus sp. TaxID=2813935 RepID=UPI00258F18E7|nr:peptide cleavage/export ABC transporter [uncultured Secundilactobacillus sp.]